MNHDSAYRTQHVLNKAYDSSHEEAGFFILVWNAGTSSFDIWDGTVDTEITGDMYVALDEVEALLSAAPVARNNPSIYLHHDGAQYDYVEKTVQGTTYRKTLTWDGSNLTVSAWVEQ